MSGNSRGATVKSSYSCFASGDFLRGRRNIGTSEGRWHEFQVAGLDGGETDS